MKRSAFFLSAAMLAAIAVAVPANAADWTGFHIGVGGGAQLTHSRLSGGADGAGTNALYGCNMDEICSQDFFDADAGFGRGRSKTSAFGTVEGGYDFQFSNIVAGFLADYNFAGHNRMSAGGLGGWTLGTHTVDNSGASPVITGTSVVDSGDGSVRAGFSLQDSWDLGVRLGFVAMPKLMLYTTGGYSQAKVNLSAVGTLEPGEELLSSAKSFGIDRSKWKSGWFVGAGAETMLARHISGSLEYRYARYGHIGVGESGVPFSIADSNGAIEGTASGGAEASKINNQSLRAVVSYRF